MENLRIPFSWKDEFKQARLRQDIRRDALRSDAAIEAEIWAGILKNRRLGEKYREHVAVESEHGLVRLRGHVNKVWHSALIADIAGRVEGVALVKNTLVADEHLCEQVIAALLQDERTAPYIFVVRCSFGWVQLGGVVPSEEIARTAERVAGFVPAVRGILSLPGVFGAPLLGEGGQAVDSGPVRRALQPLPAAVVYQDDGVGQPEAVGAVSQIIIDPCSRLVSAIAVRLTGGEEDSVHLVPMTAVEAANGQNVWLKEGETAAAYPPFDRARFPLPPAGWRPPFPYEPGSVRWSM